MFDWHRLGLSQNDDNASARPWFPFKPAPRKVSSQTRISLEVGGVDMGIPRTSHSV